ncbi:uncharacterized protein KD926_008363 [Aspergillus affinis]|uniref:uncharacterized protein n=1 Tax=Aspergillus affinis TaxID=1070780 RepID=UPI0022FDDC74|nr:uncharacterized protein KD926_008363 [Aspergillus affinis]KAI9040406.1 hypothetical protein KD926_008363 [Aspergillus affinis]
MANIDPFLRMPQICLAASRKAVLVPNRFISSLKEFHVALATALTNIVQRWVVDESDLPSRMPLERNEEDILRWIHELTEKKLFPAYEGHQGNWRPDFLLPRDKDGFQVCEINSRFPSNGIDLTALIYKSLDDSKIKPPDLGVAGDPEHMLSRLTALFHSTQARSLHFVQNEENHPMVESLMRFLGDLNPRLLKPDDLRLVSDKTSPTGYKLQSADMEDIQQVALRLFTRELASLSPEMQRQLAFLSSNDIRSMFLIHDKRILGILHQELNDLVNKHRVLSRRQADMLREHAIFTILPGSKELQELSDSYYQGKVSKDDFILKPIRSGRGQGIAFGEDLSISEWEAILADMKKPEITIPNRTVYVIQPVVDQAEGNMFLNEEAGVQPVQRVGTYHSMHGEFAALGAWRVGVSANRTTNMAMGDAWKMGSVVMKMN